MLRRVRRRLHVNWASRLRLPKSQKCDVMSRISQTGGRHVAKDMIEIVLKTLSLRRMLFSFDSDCPNT